MGLNDLILAMEKIGESQDLFAMDAASELLLIHFIPKKGGIKVQDVIEDVVEMFPEIRETVPGFDFGLWNQNTVIEAIDLMIAGGVLSGPSIDMNEESHILLESTIKRTDEMEGYIEELEEEIECFAPAPNGRAKS